MSPTMLQYVAKAMHLINFKFLYLLKIHTNESNYLRAKPCRFLHFISRLNKISEKQIPWIRLLLKGARGVETREWEPEFFCEL